MDEFIVKCVRMADVFEKLNEKVVLWKILTKDEYDLFVEMYNVYSAFKYNQLDKKEKKRKCLK